MSYLRSLARTGHETAVILICIICIIICVAGGRDGWMGDLRVYVILNRFKSYQHDGRVIMKNCVQ